MSWNIAETKSMPEVTGTLGMISKNILSAESGIWNLAQTPQKNLKFHEAKESEISYFSVVFESQIPLSFHQLKNMWNLSQILTDFDKSVRIWLKFDRF